MAPKTYHGGWWTPWAQLLCNPCHYKASDDSAPDKKPTVPMDTRGPEYALAICDRCNEKFVIDVDLALEQGILRTMERHFVIGHEGARAAMAQLGGMHHGAALIRPLRLHYMQEAEDVQFLVTADDTYPGRFCLGIYDEQDGNPIDTSPYDRHWVTGGSARKVIKNIHVMIRQTGGHSPWASPPRFPDRVREFISEGVSFQGGSPTPRVLENDYLEEASLCIRKDIRQGDDSVSCPCDPNAPHELDCPRWKK
jgi:hypothetical protein